MGSVRNQFRPCCVGVELGRLEHLLGRVQFEAPGLDSPAAGGGAMKG